VLCCHSITKITRNGINGATFVSNRQTPTPMAKIPAPPAAVPDPLAPDPCTQSLRLSALRPDLAPRALLGDPLWVSTSVPRLSPRTKRSSCSGPSNKSKGVARWTFGGLCLYIGGFLALHGATLLWTTFCLRTLSDSTLVASPAGAPPGSSIASAGDGLPHGVALGRAPS